MVARDAGVRRALLAMGLRAIGTAALTTACLATATCMAGGHHRQPCTGDGSGAYGPAYGGDSGAARGPACGQGRCGAGCGRAQARMTIGSEARCLTF